MSSPAKVVYDILSAAGVATAAATSGWGLYGDRQPAKPHTTVTTRDTGGGNPMNAWALDFPSVQVLVRGDPDDYLGAYTKAEEVKHTLTGHPGLTFVDGDLRSVMQVGDIASVGRDENDRPQLSLNFKLIIEPAVTGNRGSL